MLVCVGSPYSGESFQHWRTAELESLISATIVKEMQSMKNVMPMSNTESGVVKRKSYSEAVKNERESVIIIKQREEEEENSRRLQKEISKIKFDISKLVVGITQMRKVIRGAVMVRCENKNPS